MVQSTIPLKPALRYPWMFGATTDICFFFLPVLLGFLLFACARSGAYQSAFWALLIANAFGAGPFHQGATLFHYLDKNNRREFARLGSKRFIFFAAPFIILALTMWGTVYAYTATIGIWTVWTLQHLVQQNVGILLLYHNHKKGEAVVERKLETRSLQMAGITFFLIFVYRILFLGKAAELMVPLIVVSGCYSLILAAQYLASIYSQVRNGAYLNVPALLFWLISVLSLSPIALLGQTFEEGYLIPVTVHWFQYIALNYVLVKNKYKEDRVSYLFAPHPLLLFFAMSALLVAVNFGLAFGKTLASPHSLSASLLLGAVLGLGHIHYFLDAFLWRFREPYQRQAILPYLLMSR